MCICIQIAIANYNLTRLTATFISSTCIKRHNGAKIIRGGDFYSVCCPELHYTVNGCLLLPWRTEEGGAVIEMMKLRGHRQRGGLTQRFTFSSAVFA